MFRVTLKRLQKAASVWDLAAESKTCSSRILEFSRESVRVFGILAHIDVSHIGFFELLSSARFHGIVVLFYPVW